MLLTASSADFNPTALRKEMVNNHVNGTFFQRPICILASERSVHACEDTFCLIPRPNPQKSCGLTQLECTCRFSALVDDIQNGLRAPFHQLAGQPLAQAVCLRQAAYLFCPLPIDGLLPI